MGAADYGAVLAPVMLAVRVYYAAVSPIADCDETFIGWEPAHYLTYGSGMQTWEYSPDFGLRSWLYVMLYSWVGTAAAAMGVDDRVMVFFLTRVAAAAAMSAVDHQLAQAASRVYGAGVGGYYAVCVACATGPTLASFCFLPSSFALLCVTYALGQQLGFAPGARGACVKAFFAVIVGVLVGWPFIGLLAIPLGLDALRVYGVALPLACLLCLIPCVAYAVHAVDTAFYARPVMSTMEIVKYNVLGCLPYQEVKAEAWGTGGSLVDRAFTAIGCKRDESGARGSHLYGVEPASFFVKNLALNFNLAFPIALAAPVLVALQRLCRGGGGGGGGAVRRVWVALPFHLWFAFWMFIPHKEERFMVPAYSALALAAAVGLDSVVGILGRGWPAKAVAAAVLMTFAGVSFARTHALTEHYGAPAVIMKSVSALPASDGAVLCLGRDWYRYMSRYFVPEGVEVAFIDDGFHGLLPAPFQSPSHAPPHFNDLNRMHPSQFTPVERCTYLVASEYPSDPAERARPSAMKEWTLLAEAKMLDTAATPLLHRTFALPSGMVPGEAVYGRLILLQRAAN